MKNDPMPNMSTIAIEVERELFLRNAFFFLFHAERILNDNRMAFAPVPYQNGPYGGTNPTLGGYIEWWQTCDKAIADYNSDNIELLYNFAGSPLSGANKCACVDMYGHHRSLTITNFSKAWIPFAKINARYKNAEQPRQVYTLQEVVDILLKEMYCKVGYELFLKKLETRVLHIREKQLSNKCSLVENECFTLRRQLHETLIQLHFDEVKSFYDEYKKRENMTRLTLAELSDRKKRYKELLKQLPQPPQQSQTVFSDIKSIRLSAKDELEEFERTSLKHIFPKNDVPFYAIREYMENMEQ